MAAKSHKRIVVACDGTWVNSDNGWVRKSWSPFNTEMVPAVSSNVTRLCRALKQKSDDGVSQVVLYQAGLGSSNTFWSWLFGGYLGTGIDENIREAYAFICNNYSEGDEIILTGFSRGAFTARSIGGLISSIGLLTKHGLSSFYPIYKDWENQADKKYKPTITSRAWPLDRPSFRDPAYLQRLRQEGLTSPTIPLIKAIGVWDTVGSLGVPTLKILGIPLHTDNVIEYSFINTEVAPNVEHAYQALALDEVRVPFSPTVWESPSEGTKTALKELKQTWFPGVHTSIGGGYEDSSISDITLAWMITQLSKHLSFDKSYIPTQRSQNEEFYTFKKVPVRSWAMGLIQRSDEGFMNTMTGRGVRTPGEYHPTDPLTGKPKPTKMKKTCEFVHPSVRYRIEQKGAGLAAGDKDFVGKGVYQPDALKGWNFQVSGDVEGMSPEEVHEWQGYGKWVVQRKGEDKPTYIVEEKIEPGTAEMDLITGWPDGWKGVQNKLYAGFRD